MSNFFGSSSTNNEATQAELGSRLYNIKQSSIGTESVLSILPDNNVVVNTCSSFGKSLLNVSTLNQLVGLINSGDSKVEVIDSTTGEINFTLDNALKLVVKNAYTEVLNELRTLNVKPATDLGADLGDANKRYNTGFIRKITTNSVGQVSIGDGASTLGTSSVNIGNGSGGTGAPDFSVSIGRGANSEQSHTASICLGYASGQKGSVQKSGIIAIGHSAGTGITGVQGMNNNAIAIGSSSSLNGGAVDSIAIGAGANGNSVVNDYSVAIGSGAGSTGQGNHCIAIGRLAGQTNQHNSTIIINGQNNTALNSGQANSLYIAPIRSGGTGNVLNYDTGSKEVLVGGVASMSGISISGNINPDSTASNRTIGSSGNRFNNIHSTTFTGSLSGNASSSSLIAIFDSRYGALTRPTSTIAEFRARQQQEISELCEAGAANLYLGVGNHWGVSKTIVPWADPSGGRMYQHYYASNGIVYFRKSSSTTTPPETWSSWKDVSPDKCILTDSTDTITGTKTFSSDILFDADNQRNVGSNGQALNSVFAHNGNFKSIQVHSATGGNIGSLVKPFDTIFLLNADIGNLVSNIKSMNITPTATNTYTIGSSSSTQYNAIYSNSVYSNGVILTSDVNKKKDIQPIEDALSVIMRFESKSFKFKDGTSNRTHTGFIAQQVKEVIPDDWALYCDNKLGDIGLKYTEVIPLNTRAIQQLNERLTKIENRKLVGKSVIDTSSLTEDMTQIYERLDYLSRKLVELENQPEKPQLHRCVEISRINELYDRITNLEGRLSAFDEVKDSDESELVSSLNEKVNLLILKNQELESKLERLPKVEAKCNDLLESDGGLNMNELLQQKNFELEQRLIKVEKQNKRLVQAVNKLLKSNEV